MKVIIKLREVRLQKGINLHQLSQMTGISYSTIWEIDSGNQMPKIDTLCAIAMALKVDMKELYECKR